jgi:hypothetical protein
MFLLVTSSLSIVYFIYRRFSSLQIQNAVRFHYLETMQNVRMTGAYLNAIPGKAFLRKKLDSLTRSLL